MSKESKTIFEHIETMEKEINWVGLNGHLEDDDVQTKVKELSEKLHELRKIAEALS